ncbi:MAG: hypothetical protein FE041_05985 [Thermoplasmata archaeon]|nr:MAG: hypothetical protein FE041_05985 [Thermoplasmata archaeon]
MEPPERLEDNEELINFLNNKSRKLKRKWRILLIVAIILGATVSSAIAYHAYTTGKKLKGDGSYFFHHPNDYWKYLTAKDKNDIDGDGIPNDIEEKYGLNMFYAGDAGEDWNHNGFTNLHDYQLGLDPTREYPKVFIDLLHKLSANEQKAYCNEFVKNTNLTREGLQQVEFLLSLSDDEFQQALEQGLIANNNWDGDGFSNYFDEFISNLYDPLIPNDRYAILVSDIGFCPTETYWEKHDEAIMNYTVSKDIKRWLIEKEGFPEENIIELGEPANTFENFTKAMDKIAKVSDENDIVYISLVGHGGNGFFCFENKDNPNSWRWYTRISKVLDKINCKALIITIDACYSGSAIEPLSKGKQPRIVMTQTTADRPGGNAELVRYFITGLADPDIDKDGNGFISVKEAFIGARRAIAYNEKMRMKEFRVSKEEIKIPQFADPHNLSDKIYIGDYTEPERDRIIKGLYDWYFWEDGLLSEEETDELLGKLEN